MIEKGIKTDVRDEVWVSEYPKNFDEIDWKEDITLEYDLEVYIKGGGIDSILAYNGKLRGGITFEDTITEKTERFDISDFEVEIESVELSEHGQAWVGDVELDFKENKAYIKWN